MMERGSIFAVLASPPTRDAGISAPAPSDLLPGASDPGIGPARPPPASSIALWRMSAPASGPQESRPVRRPVAGPHARGPRRRLSGNPARCPPSTTLSRRWRGARGCASRRPRPAPPGAGAGPMSGGATASPGTTGHASWSARASPAARGRRLGGEVAAISTVSVTGHAGEKRTRPAPRAARRRRRGRLWVRMASATLAISGTASHGGAPAAVCVEPALARETASRRRRVARPALRSARSASP